MTVGCVKLAMYALRDAIMSETVHNATKVLLLFTNSIIAFLLHNDERDLSAIDNQLITACTAQRSEVGCFQSYPFVCVWVFVWVFICVGVYVSDVHGNGNSWDPVGFPREWE